MARKLIVEVVGDTSRLTTALRTGRAETESFGKSLGRLSIGFGSIVKGALVFEAVNKALEGITATIHAGTDELKQRAIVQAQTEAVIKSTGAAAHVTAGQLDEMSLSLSNLSGQNTQTIKSSANLLLGFTKVQNFAGKGNQIFNRAMQASLDVAARTHRTLDSSTVAIGRALQDPAKAAGSLRRAFIVLTADEQKAIKTALAHGDTLKAQKLILQDLERRAGGAAAAFGKTLPGQIAILRARFRDLSGDILGSLMPAFSRGVTGLTNFVKALSQAHGTKAKLEVVWTGIENLTRGFVSLVRRAIDAGVAAVRRIDWSKVARAVENGLNSAWQKIRDVAGPLAKRIGDELRSVDWPSVIRQVAAGLSTAVVWLLQEFRTLIKSIDWSKVGKWIVDGLALAAAAVVKFIASINWGAIAKALWNLLKAAIRAENQLYLAIGKEIGRLMWKGLQAGLDELRKLVEKPALKIALAIVSPFAALPSWLGGGWAKSLQRSLQGQLDALSASASAGGKQVAGGFVGGFTEWMSAGTQAMVQATGAAVGAATGAAGGVIRGGTSAAPSAPSTAGTGAGAGAGAGLPPPPGATNPSGLSTKDRAALVKRAQRMATQRNQWFDSMVSRDLDRVQDLPLRQQIAKLEDVRGIVQKRLDVTKDITRRLTLEDTVLQITRTIKSTRDQVRQTFLDSLQLGIDKAGLTKSLQDDLKAMQALLAGLKKQLKTTTDVVGVQQQIVAVEGQIAATQKQIRQNRHDAKVAREYRELGLTSAGDPRVIGIKSLRRELEHLSTAVAGTSLDTVKNRSMFARIRKTITDSMAPPEVRQKVADMLQAVKDELNQAGPALSKWHGVGTQNLLKGLGLSPEQLRKARAQLARVGPGAVTSAGVGAVFGGGHNTYIREAHFHGITDMRKFEDEMAKRDRARPHRRRGAQ